MRYAENLAEYEKGKSEGIIDENVFVIVLEEKVAKFKGQTFDWSGGGADIDLSTLATKEELTNLTNEMVANEEIVASSLNDLNNRLGMLAENVQGETVTKEEFETAVSDLNESLEAKADASATSEAISGLQISVNGINAALVGYATTESLNGAVETINNTIVENEEIAAAALNDLNSQIKEIITRLNNAGL